jgi:hypothetical protein
MSRLFCSKMKSESTSKKSASTVRVQITRFIEPGSIRRRARFGAGAGGWERLAEGRRELPPLAWSTRRCWAAPAGVVHPALFRPATGVA